MKTLFKVIVATTLLSGTLLTTAYAQSSGGIVFDTPVHSSAVNENTNTATVAGNSNTNTTTMTNSNTNTTTATANPILDAKLEIKNLTQSKDATAIKNKASDVIRVTATLGNLGPGDVKNKAAQIIAEELFKLGTVIDSGAGGVLTLGKAMVYPAVNITEDCNCQETFQFSVKLNENMCKDYPALVKTGALVKFEDQQNSLSFDCTEDTTTTVTPTRPVITSTPTTETTPPKTPQTGPEALILLGAAAAMGGYNVLRRRKK